MKNKEELNEENAVASKSFDAVEYFENNKKNVLTVVGVLFVAIVAYFAYKQFIVKPKQEEGIIAIKDVQKYYGLDSFKMVISSTSFPNAIELADEYSGTQVGELANYYAGTSYLQLGDFESAIEYLENVSFSDKVLKYQTMSALGDAYVESGDLNKGLELYKDAAKGLKDQLAQRCYIKAGNVMEKLEMYEEAIIWYTEAKIALADPNISREFDFFIAKNQAKVSK